MSGTPCRLLSDCDEDGLADQEDTGTNATGTPCHLLPDCDGDGLADQEDTGMNASDTPCRVLPDCDEDGLVDLDDTGTNATSGTSCHLLPDCDADGLNDELDVDSDGDGLIELRMAAELDNMRYMLHGTGVRENATAAIDSTGCPSEGGCIGYELAADIDMMEYIERTYPYAGWQPLGGNGEIDRNGGCAGDPFNAIFDGNDYIISGLFIYRPEESCIGLFGFMAGSKELRNTHLDEVDIAGAARVGGLVGSGEGVRITASYVTGDVTGEESVGGLVGNGTGAEITASYAMGTVIVIETGTGTGNNVGGLVGNGRDAIINASYATNDVTVTETGNNVGGLVGNGEGARITDSYAQGTVAGEESVGGLVGNGEGARITDSYARGAVAGTGDNVGGLVGNGEGAMVTSSYWDNESSDAIETDEYAKITVELGHSDNFIYSFWHGRKCPGTEEDVWDFGTDTQYPAITCTPGGLDIQQRETYYAEFKPYFLLGSDSGIENEEHSVMTTNAMESDTVYFGLLKAGTLFVRESNSQLGSVKASLYRHDPRGRKLEISVTAENFDINRGDLDPGLYSLEITAATAGTSDLNIAFKPD